MANILVNKVSLKEYYTPHNKKGLEEQGKACMHKTLTKLTWMNQSNFCNYYLVLLSSGDTFIKETLKSNFSHILPIKGGCRRLPTHSLVVCYPQKMPQE